LVPSERVIVPMSLAMALPDAVAVPVVVTGGHAPAQAPLQLDMSPVSFTHRYTARPEPLVRKVPAEDLAVVMTVPPDELALPEEDAPAGEAGADAGALLGLLGVLVLLVLPALLHAATTTAATSPPPTPATSLVRLDIGPNLDFRIVLSSCPARFPAPGVHESLSIDVRAERRGGFVLDESTTYDLGHYLNTDSAIRLSSVTTRGGGGG
jgi:hypothetical protein